MSKDYPRSYRVGDQIQRELAQLLRTELKDPRASQFITVSAVELSRDLSVAKIYITVLEEDKRDGTMQALQHAAGFLRREIGRRIRLRIVPELRFHYDDLQERSQQLTKAIADAVRSDEKETD